MHSIYQPIVVSIAEGSYRQCESFPCWIQVLHDCFWLMDDCVTASNTNKTKWCFNISLNFKGRHRWCLQELKTVQNERFGDCLECFRGRKVIRMKVTLDHIFKNWNYDCIFISLSTKLNFDDLYFHQYITFTNCFILNIYFHFW